MLICPDCRVALQDLKCLTCAWEAKENSGIMQCIGKKDMENPIIQSYLKNYDKIGVDDISASIQPERYVINIAKNLANKVKLKNSDKIADIGTGRGFLLNFLLANGATDITAIDICEEYLNALVKDSRVKCVQANAENLPFKDHFDIVTATDILEHVLNVGSFLYSLNKSLKQGGYAYIRVPFRENLMSYSTHLGCPYEFVHLRTFNKTLLVDCLKQAGFVVKYVYNDGFWINFPNKFWLSFLRGKFYKSLIEPLLRRVMKNPEDITLYPAWLCKLLMRPFEIVIIAQKKHSNF